LFNVVYSQNNILLTAKFFFSMTPRLNTDCAKNYYNRTLIVQFILENVVTCYFLRHSVYMLITFMPSPVSMSQGWISQKRLKLGLWNFYHS